MVLYCVVVLKMLWVILACVALGVSGDDSLCCLSNGPLIRSQSDPHHCSDANGTNTPVSLTCAETVMITDSTELRFVVADDGKLKLLLPNREVSYAAGKFCEGHVETADKDQGTVVRKKVALICNERVERVIDEETYGYAMLISAIFLFVTATVYGTRAELRDLQGKSIMNLCVSLGIGLTLLVVMKLVPYSDMNWCAARGFFAYFFIVASFFWMNAVSIQILWGLKQPQGASAESSSKEFVYFALYAWGVPALLSAMMAIINFMPGDHLKPGIGLNHCWFFNVQQQWNYMYSVVSVLILINILIFTTSTVFICCYGYPTYKKCFRQKFVTCLQLLVVMGIPWIFEMIGSLAPHHLAWEILDLFNSLQGVWIFLVLVALVQREKEEEEDSSMYKINITVDQPYSKVAKY